MPQEPRPIFRCRQNHLSQEHVSHRIGEPARPRIIARCSRISGHDRQEMTGARMKGGSRPFCQARCGIGWRLCEQSVTSRVPSFPLASCAASRLHGRNRALASSGSGSWYQANCPERPVPQGDHLFDGGCYARLEPPSPPGSAKPPDHTKYRCSRGRCRQEPERRSAHADSISDKCPFREFPGF